MSANLKSFAFSLKLFVLFRLKEIDRNDPFGDLFSHCSHLLVLGVIGVMIESSTVGEMNDEARIERAFKVQNISADVKSHNIVDHRRQSA